jgi:hypothetical protein
MTHDELLARVDERQQAMDDKLDAILEQTKKTNGRLDRAEDKIRDLILWKEVRNGQLKIIWVVVLGIVSLIGWIISVISGS